jgi:ribosomal protein L29
MPKRKEKIKDFRRIGREEALRILSEEKEKLRQLIFDKTAGKVKNVREIKEKKKDIARLLTLLKEKS